MRVVEITQSLGLEGGGVASSVLDMSRHMKSPEFDVHLFSAMTESARDNTADFAGKAHLNKSFGPTSFAFQPALRGDLAGLDPEVVHLHGLWGYPSFVLASEGRRAAKIISPHGMLDGWARRNAGWKKDIVSALFEKRNIGSACCIRALCVSERSTIKADFPKAPIAVIPNGVNIPTPKTLGETAGWRHSLPPDAKVILFLGRIHPKKGLASLLAAFSILRRQNAIQKWHLVIAGWNDGQESGALRRAVASAGLSDVVHFVGPQFGLNRDLSYRGADLFILPSFSEGLPMAILEAWSYALPVLMTRECNLPEGFASGAAIEIETEPGALAKVMRDVLSMETNTLRDIGQKGRSLVEERFSWARVTADMKELYRWAANPQTDAPDFVEFGAVS